MTSTRHNLPAAAVSALESGRNVDAIRIIRQETGLGLKEAKNLVDEYLHHSSSAASGLEVQQPASSADIPAGAIYAIQKGSKIEAVRILREHTGLGLKQAKELIEKYINENPTVRSRLAARQRQTLQGIRWLVISILIIGLTYYYLFIN